MCAHLSTTIPSQWTANSAACSFSCLMQPDAGFNRVNVTKEVSNVHVSEPLDVWSHNRAQGIETTHDALLKIDNRELEGGTGSDTLT